MEKLIGELNIGEHLYCFGTDGTIIDVLITDKRKYHPEGITRFEGNSQLIQGNNPYYANLSMMTWYCTPQTLKRNVSYDVASNINDAKKIVSTYVFCRNKYRRRQ